MALLVGLFTIGVFVFGYYVLRTAPAENFAQAQEAIQSVVVVLMILLAGVVAAWGCSGAANPKRDGNKGDTE